MCIDKHLHIFPESRFRKRKLKFYNRKKNFFFHTAISSCLAKLAPAQRSAAPHHTTPHFDSNICPWKRRLTSQSTVWCVGQMAYNSETNVNARTRNETSRYGRHGMAWHGGPR
uniref:Uncharacterized protein n=1 Tax=Ceratitis capitata TaxID=7213 RepID=W8B2H9_CERCA